MSDVAPPRGVSLGGFLLRHARPADIPAKRGFASCYRWQNLPPIFHLPSTTLHPLNLFAGFLSFFSCILPSESSESFSCILYTESSESWTTAFPARMVDRVRVSKNNDPSSIPPFLEPTDSPPGRVQEKPSGLINPPAIPATTSHKGTVLLISKHLRGYLRGNTLHSSECRASFFDLNSFHCNDLHCAPSRFRAFLSSCRPPLRHTPLATLVLHPIKAS